MAKYRASARIVGSKYLGEFEAENEDEAKLKAENSSEAHVSLCHQCSDECEDPECDEVFVELIED